MSEQLSLLDVPATPKEKTSRRVKKTPEERAAEKAEKKAAKKAAKAAARLAAATGGGFEKIPLEQLTRYAAIDTDMTWRLVGTQAERIRDEQNAYISEYNRVGKDRYRDPGMKMPRMSEDALPVRALLRRNVLPVTPVLAEVEYLGVRCDRQHLTSLDAQLTKVIDEQAAALKDMVGRDDVNLNSNADVAKILFEDGYYDPNSGDRIVHDLEGVGRTATGQIQTTAKVMKYLLLRDKSPFAEKKLLYAKATKARDTVVANAMQMSAYDGFLHSNYNQHGTATGRLSSSGGFNMQNVGKKDEKMLAGVNLKKIFVPDDDSYVFVNADAKGAEVRVLTAYCRDEALIESLRAGQDTHCFIASKIVEVIRADNPAGAKEQLAAIGLDDAYPLTYEDFAARDALKNAGGEKQVYGTMLNKFRDAVKRVVFGILYGAGAKKIAETIGISVEQAQTIIDLIFRLFPAVKHYMMQTQWELRTFGFVETFFGRRRRYVVPGAAKYMWMRAERQTVNFKIQSTNSEIVMGRLVAAHHALRDLGGRMLLTVHDSLGFQLPKKYAAQLPDFVREVLQKGANAACPWLPVDFAWDCEVGPSYGELQSVEKYLAGSMYKPAIGNGSYTEDEIMEDLAEAALEEVGIKNGAA